MKTKEPLTRVTFRRWRKEGNQIIALFPREAATVATPSHCLSYMHVGQHSAADFMTMLRCTVRATPKEYRDLANELRRIGYRLKITFRSYISDFRARQKQLASQSPPFLPPALSHTFDVRGRTAVDTAKERTTT